MTRSDPKLVSLSYFLPYIGVDHAGGQLLLDHYRVLTNRCGSLNSFAIALESNLTAAGRDHDVHSSRYHATVLKFPRWRRTLLGKVIARVWFILFPIFPDIGTVASFLSSRRLREDVIAADIVELQWFEYLFFGCLVRMFNPRAQIIGYSHDVPSQKIDRRWAGKPAVLKWLYMSYVTWLERRLLRGVDRVTVLSAKDAELIARRTSSVEIFVLDPPLGGDKEHRLTWADEGAEEPSFGFVGAFHRKENDDAAKWLLTEIWPEVLKKCPEAVLYLVGSQPSSELSEISSNFSGSVQLTGYVPDLEAFYGRFQTMVIPLRYGAGVKFKTITGILKGKNIVATPVAIEGVLSAEHFYRVSNSASELAAAMIELALNPRIGRDALEKAHAAVGNRYSFANYSAAVSEVYRLDP